MNIASISPSELTELFASGRSLDLIDVCTPVEYREVHIGFARNIPLEHLDPADVMASRRTRGEEPIYVICRSGNRGRLACEKILKAGYAHVVNVEGGMAACVDAGLPVVRGKKAFSLERQVRIAVGSFVVLGVALGWLIHAGFFAMAAFMGAGLIFAGVTDTCAMGLLLARMPWNRCAQPSHATCPSSIGIGSQANGIT